jgi:hypothetical protein
MPTLTLPLLEEVSDSLAVVAVVTSAVYWWRASHSSYAAVESNTAARTRLNAKAATHAAIAATLQAVSVLVHILTIGRWF